MFIFKQTDSMLPANFNRYGCRFMSLLAIPQFVAQQWIGAIDIIKIYEKLKERPGVFKDAASLTMGPQEHLVINAGFHLLKLPMHGAQIGVIEDGAVVRWKWARDEGQFPATHCIAHWLTDGKDGHWTLFDMHGQELYDPHDPEQAGYKINKKQIDKFLVYSYWEI